MRRATAFLCAVLLCCVFLPGCRADAARHTVTYADVFDTVTELTVYGGSEAEFSAGAAAVHAELLRLHQLFDIYHAYEGVVNLHTINEAGGAPVTVGEESDIMRLLSLGIAQYTATGGKLNIAIGALTALWHEARETGVLPEDAALQEAATHCCIENVTLAQGVVTLTDPALRLDVGAIAKGYAAERAREAARAAGFADFALNLGGNVITEGQKPQGNWRVGVSNPNGGVLTALSVSGVAVVTSGDYQRYVEIGGVRYHHIIDSTTRYPAAGYRAVTVVCADSAVADALSTALFLSSVEEGKVLLAQHGAAALWITATGEVIRSEEFSQYEDQ